MHPLDDTILLNSRYGLEFYNMCPDFNKFCSDFYNQVLKKSANTCRSSRYWN